MLAAPLTESVSRVEGTMLLQAAYPPPLEAQRGSWEQSRSPETCHPADLQRQRRSQTPQGAMGLPTAEDRSSCLASTRTESYSPHLRQRAVGASFLSSLWFSLTEGAGQARWVLPWATRHWVKLGHVTEELHGQGSQLGPLSREDKVLPGKKRARLSGEGRTEQSRPGSSEMSAWRRQGAPGRM